MKCLRRWITIVLIGIILIPGKIEAGIQIIPAKVMETISQENNSFTIKITNNGQEDMHIHAYTGGLGQDEEGGAIYYDENDPEKSKDAKLITPSPSCFSLSSGASVTVTAKVDIPPERKGGIYGIVYFEVVPHFDDKNEQTQGIFTHTRLAVLTLLEIQGETNKQGKITEVNLFQEKPAQKIRFVNTFHNTGDVHVIPMGKVIIRDDRGRVIKEVFVEGKVVLPACRRPLTAYWEPENLTPGLYTAETIFKDGQQLLAKELTLFEMIQSNEIAIKRGEIVSFSSPNVVQYSPINFNLLFRNKGNVRIFTEGMIEIKDQENRLILKIPVKGRSILPNQTEELKAVLPEGLSRGSYIAQAEIRYGDMKGEVNFTVAEKEIIVAAEISEFNIASVESSQPIEAFLYFKNTGNIEFYTEGMILIKTSQNKTVGQVTVDRILIRPGYKERLGGTWKGELPMGLYKGEVTLIFGEDRIAKEGCSFLITK